MSNYTLNDLEAVLDRLPDKDRSFAADLVAKGRKYRLSEKQAYWVNKLAQRGRGEDALPATANIGDLLKVIALFDRAAQHLKYPKVILACGDKAVKLSIAGERAKVPGSVTVAGASPDKPWFGRITRDGVFHASRTAETVPNLVEHLRAFAREPAAVAAAYGHLTGHCCFCARRLDDERSTKVGYGPICATHFGLPWGDRPTLAEKWGQ
jgi:hypothetical protein